MVHVLGTFKIVKTCSISISISSSIFYLLIFLSVNEACKCNFLYNVVDRSSRKRCLSDLADYMLGFNLFQMTL